MNHHKMCHPGPMADDTLMSTAEAAEWIGVTVGTLQRWALDGHVTPALRLPGGEYRWDRTDLRTQLRPDRPMPPPRNKPKTGGLVPETSSHRPPVITAIVVSSLGVLLGHRIDRKPPWTFIAGENEPGESPADTIIREVKEETGLDITAGDILGERDHPATGRHLIYVLGNPAGDLDPIIGDPDELDEVRWATLTEALDLLPGMYEPVEQYLRQTLGKQAPDQQ
jgi:excisionase family DNA binding protein